MAYNICVTYSLYKPFFGNSYMLLSLKQLDLCYGSLLYRHQDYLWLCFSAMFHSIMTYSAVDITLYIKYMLWACAIYWLSDA